MAQGRNISSGSMGLSPKGLIIRDGLILRRGEDAGHLGHWEKYGMVKHGKLVSLVGTGGGEEGVVIKVKRLGAAWEAWGF